MPGRISLSEVDSVALGTHAAPDVAILCRPGTEDSGFYRDILEQVRDAIIAVDGKNRVIYLNPAAERLYGLVQSSALGRDLSEIHYSSWGFAETGSTEVILLCDSCESRDECVHIRNDGRPVTVEVTMTSLRNGGKPPGIRFLLIHDVTERKQLDAKLAVSEIRYRRLFEAAHDGVLILDPDTRKIIDANPFMTTLLEYGKEQLIGKELFEIGLLKDEAASKEMFRHLQSLQEVRYENLPLKTRNGRHQDVEVVANLYDEGGHPMIQCNIRDITERRRGEEHVKLLMAEVNHRARNLLALVQAFAHQTAKHGDPTTFMTRLSNRLDGLAAGQDLMVRSQSQGVELADLVEVQVAHFKDLIGTRLLITGPRHMMLNMAAAQGIGMAVHELGTNAAKYGALSNQDGRVVITWKITSSAEPMFSMSWLEEDGPRVVPPTRKGFGQAVIGRMAEASVDGHVELLYPKSGLTWTLSAPAKNVFMPTDPNNLMRRHDDA